MNFFLFITHNSILQFSVEFKSEKPSVYKDIQADRYKHSHTTDI
ncbi:MAG: hypothetical protein JETT_2067 [Candidatus Jettenia ecosi]|uniref:Uncharacterized protein n=1 Tax=Candidatus Jettenia ecosi TaxID=2494326 RepID=A0A533QG57_9BACT|nr:MAG: hypothetical protein JETT_2067 [Candidatus Jettenia ecosi]